MRDWERWLIFAAIVLVVLVVAFIWLSAGLIGL